ncbi:glutamyl-Q tRNA(Asp) synthetase [Bifidobacterium margollesii]|uniref:glutamyl-Q tRNA(Asp) synthetase n=1 Tax=Bifidobacterium margollesii TaxID=2020964 RepID=UPI001A9CB5A6|nr:glutamyl-Q tRNA(Asp) synthetase [Bifidobacterium margollesii]
MVGRLAPSPTGRMHIGNVYAALAAWLGVRSRNGRLLLRIEDIDTPRVRKDADRWIMDDLHWLGLDWDGEPIYQSQRIDRYDQAIELLKRRSVTEADGITETGASSTSTTPLIYPCFCSRADIRAASAPNEGDGFIVYPGTCRRLDPQIRAARLARGDRHSWRIAMPANRVETFDDLIFGAQRFDLTRELGDVVVKRSDGLFAYQLAVTVDDLLTGVNQIVRGRDLLRSTAVQLWIRENLIAAGFTTPSVPQSQSHETSQSPQPARPLPQFAHLPLIDDPTGRRLAKRDKAWDLGAMREEGIAPQRIIGYCAWLLGLRPTAAPCTPDELLPGFSWRRIATNRADRLSDPHTLTQQP